ncbi:MAG: GNAT family N-acetyltransferase [Nitrospiraceae bacterium]|nr:GNAT family N-acetyltransferase [Nitrospiraceae bacterium]
MPVLDQLNVRCARAEDTTTIVSFSAAMALETEGRHLDLDRLHLGTIALLENPERGFFIVAEQGEGARRRLLGQLMVTYEWSDWRNGAFWWIQSVYVDPAWRRQGVYRLMHDSIVAHAKADTSVCGVRLYVEKDNGAAQVVYRKVGLTPSSYAIFETDFVLALPRGLKDHPNEA